MVEEVHRRKRSTKYASELNAQLPIAEQKLRQKIKKFAIDRGSRQSTKTDLDLRHKLILGQIKFQSILHELAWFRRDRINGYVKEYVRMLEKRHPDITIFQEELKLRIESNCIDSIDYWLLGLTTKGAKKLSKDVLRSLIKTHISSYSSMLGHALNMVGASINGSTKSKTGKELERAILRDIMRCLGFPIWDSKRFYEQFHKSVYSRPKNLCSLNHTLENRRQVDMAMYVNFAKSGFTAVDITFASDGNTEVAGDKATRYENYHEEMPCYTLVFIPSMGKRGKMKDIAQNDFVDIVEFEDENMILSMAKYLLKIYGYSHEILSIPSDQLEEWTNKRLQEQKLGRKNEIGEIEKS